MMVSSSRTRVDRMRSRESALLQTSPSNAVLSTPKRRDTTSEKVSSLVIWAGGIARFGRDSLSDQKVLLHDCCRGTVTSRKLEIPSFICFRGCNTLCQHHPAESDGRKLWDGVQRLRLNGGRMVERAHQQALSRVPPHLPHSSRTRIRNRGSDTLC